MTVTFFGHRDAPLSVKPLLKKVIIDLIENHNADVFYVGNQGYFDHLVLNVLNTIKSDYPHIKPFVVLAYLPTQNLFLPEDIQTIYPDGIEYVPLRFAICKRNEWMISKSNIAVTYVNHNFGGAAKYKKSAVKKGLTVIELTTM